jgi:D-alanyl-D-alanine carboxypeptidase
MKTTVPALAADGTYAGFDYGLGLMRIPLSQVCGTGPAVWGHGGDVFGFNTWSMHDEHGDRQISTLANQDVTPSPDAAAKRILVMVNEFCTTSTARSALQPDKLAKISSYLS